MILAWLALAFLAGLVLGAWFVLPILPAIVIACLAVGAAFLLRRTPWQPLLLILAAFCLGVARSPHPAGPPSPGDLAYYNGSQVQLQGVVDAEPDIRDTGANYTVVVRQVTLHGRSVKVSGRLELHTPRSQQLDYGDAVALTGRLLTPQNSTTVPYRDVLAQRGIYSQMLYPRVADQGRTNTGWLGWLVPLRQRLESGIDAWLPEPEAALLIAITLGARSASLGDLTPVLISTGLIHVIAISGIKVALVAGTVHQVARRLLNRTMTLAVSLGTIALYVLLTGATASGERSALMWAMVFLAAYLGRGTVALVSLCLVAALMAAFEPGLPWDIGFQLSTIGTFAIVAYTDPLLTIFRYLISPFREAFCVTVSAQAGTVPVVAVGFHLVSATGPLANMLVLPFLPILIVVGFLLGMCSGLAAVAAPIAAFAYILLHSVIALAAWLSSLVTAVPIPNVSPPFTVAYYVVMAGVAYVILRRVHFAPSGRLPAHGRELSLSLVFGVSILTTSLPLARDRTQPLLYSLGTGDALVLRANGQTALIDGSPKPFQLLERLGSVLPFTVRTIDLVVVTDPRAASAAGLDAVLAHYSVSEVLDVGAEYPSTSYARWRADLRAQHIPVYALRTGASTQIGPIRLQAIGPDDLYPDARNSVGLLRLSLPGRTLLLAGAASRREQLEAVFRPVNLRANTLILDGSAGAVPAFLRAVHSSTVLTHNPMSALPGARTLPARITAVQ